MCEKLASLEQRPKSTFAWGIGKDFPKPEVSKRLSERLEEAVTGKIKRNRRVVS